MSLKNVFVVFVFLTLSKELFSTVPILYEPLSGEVFD